MITYLIIASGIVGWVCIFAWLITRALYDKPFGKTKLMIFITITLAYLMYSTSKFEIQKPCVEYETRMMYNAATKTMMPARVCIERGEWIND